MTDVTHDEMDDGFHEIHLSGKQLFALFMATVVVSVVIFLIGVFVGRNVRSQQAAAAEHLSDSAAALTPAPVRQPAPAPAASQSALEAAEPPTPPAETDELSYKRRLEGPCLFGVVEDAGAAPRRASRRAPHRRRRLRPERPLRRPRRRRPRQGRLAHPSRAPGSSRFTSFAIARPPTASSAAWSRKGYPAFLVAAGPPTGQLQGPGRTLQGSR